MYWTMWLRERSLSARKLKGLKVDGVVGLVVHATEGDSHETLTGVVLPSDQDFDGSVVELHTVQPGGAVAKPGIEGNDGVLALRSHRGCSVRDGPSGPRGDAGQVGAQHFLGIDTPSETKEAGEGKKN